MQSKRKPSPGLKPLIASAAVLAAVLALAIPALAHRGDDKGPRHDNPAGKIAAYDATAKVLTIDLAAGGSVSGLVTRSTWIHSDWHRDCGKRHERRGRHGSWCRGKRLHGFGHGRGSIRDLIPGAVVENAIVALADGRAVFVKVDLDD